MSGQIFNLGTGQPYYKLFSYYSWWKRYIYQIDLENQKTCANNTKLKRSKWQPKIKFYNGVNEMLKNLND